MRFFLKVMSLGLIACTIFFGCKAETTINSEDTDITSSKEVQNSSVQCANKSIDVMRLTGLERAATLIDDHFESPDHEWAKWVVINNAPTRINFPAWSDEKIQNYIDKYIPDHMGEWGGPSVNRGDFCRMRGIASNTTHEYGSNECLNELRKDGQHIPGNNGYTRCHAMMEMHDNGVGVREDGSYSDAGWSRTHLMCQNAPKWQFLSQQASSRQAVYGESIFQDKFAQTISPLDQGYCIWCNRRFKEYMQANFTKAELDEMGFDPTRFSLTNYVTTKRKSMSPSQLLEDAIIHEYIRFQYIYHLYWSVDIIDQYHESAAKAKRPIPAFYGNQSGMCGAAPFSIILSDYVDIVWVEQAHSSQRPLDLDIQADSTLLFKLGRAASHYKKPVWTLQYPAGNRHKWNYGFGADKKYPTVLANAEATANGGVMCQTWVATPYNNQKISEALLEGHSRHAHFVDKNRGLFVDRKPVVDHALVYSLPSMFWRCCYKLSLRDWPYKKHFSAAARLLEDSHIPYNALVFGHKDVFDDTEDIASLCNYKTIIIPYADCISDAQANAIKEWTRAGGKLVLWAAEIVGTRDEEMAPRSVPVFNSLISNPGLGTVELITTEQAKGYLASGRKDDNVPKVIATTVGSQKVTKQAKSDVAPVKAEVLAPKIIDIDSPVVKTDAPETLWLNVWRHGAGPMMSVQMVNNDLNVEADTYTPVQNFTVSLREPEGVTFTKVSYYNTGYSSEVPTKPVDLSFIRKGNYIRVAVTKLDMFGILVFSVDNELEARMEASHTRKWYEKLKIALRCPDANKADYTTLLSETQNLLDQIQGNVTVSNFASLIEPMQNKAAQLESALNDVTEAMTATQKADKDAAIDVVAYKKFDFGESGAPSGWTQVAASTLYSESQGYGWMNTRNKTAVNHGETDLLHRDFVRSKDPAKDADNPINRHFPYTNPDTHPGHFKVDLPNGNYIVTIITGDYEEFRTGPGGGPANEGRTAMTFVKAEGIPVLYGDRSWGGFFPNRTFRTTVTDGQLDVVFSGMAVGPLYCNPIEWMVNGMIIQTINQTPTPAAQRYLDKAEALSEAAIRHWSVIGPFDDDDCLGLETIYGPEKSIDITKTYTGKNGTVYWQTLTPLNGSAPYISLSETFNDIEEVAGFALTYVYCPDTTKAVLVSSLSQSGIIYVNGQVVFVDRLAAGLLPDEQYIDIKLHAGWNSILIKSLNYWGRDWSLWAGLMTKDGKPLGELKGVKISATVETD